MWISCLIVYNIIRKTTQKGALSIRKPAIFRQIYL
jgi:hypothetical protein